MLQWMARIWSGTYLMFFLFMLVAHMLNLDDEPSNPPTAIEVVSFVFVFIYFIGLIIGWKNERLGGFIAIAGTLGFGVMNPNAPDLVGYMAIPAMLYLIVWLLTRRQLRR